MSRDDLPLFNWSPVCQFIAFPLNKRVGRVRRVAEVYDRKNERDRDGYWHATLNKLVKQLERIGYSDEQITTEINDFAIAVRDELYRLQQVRARYGRSGPGGAA